jgi:flagellar L-ring protein precursor FlgH
MYFFESFRSYIMALKNNFYIFFRKDRLLFKCIEKKIYYRPIVIGIGFFSFSLFLSGCRTMHEMIQTSKANQKPPLTAPQDITRSPEHISATTPTPELQIPTPLSNSLWKEGARAFFQDQRACRVGDILTVRVVINDKANFKDNLETKRSSKTSAPVPKLFGLEKNIDALGGGLNHTGIFGSSSNTNRDHSGKLDRAAAMTFILAVRVIEVLPTGVLVIYGRQEIRADCQSRDLSLYGFIRPEDISSNNEIPIEKVAEARMIYGGRGVLSNNQSASPLTQLTDIVL